MAVNNNIEAMTLCRLFHLLNDKFTIISIYLIRLDEKFKKGYNY